MPFRLIIEQRVLGDLQSQVNYYQDQSAGLGRKFYNEVTEHFRILKNIPFLQIRYGSIRSIPLKKFPFMIHYSVNEKNKTVTVHAILHTSMDPDGNWGRDEWIINEQMAKYERKASARV
jgi:hypothetical protein